LSADAAIITGRWETGDGTRSVHAFDLTFTRIR
jgi:hypothetical protein